MITFAIEQGIHPDCFSLQPNGLRVLAKAPGLIDRLHGWHIDNMLFYSDLAEDRGVIAENDVPKRLRARLGASLFGIRRPVVLQALVNHAEAAGVPVKWGHKLVSLEQGADSVKVKFANGAEDTGSFVIGCDGLHSNTRICLFGETPADFTGLTQVRKAATGLSYAHRLRKVRWHLPYSRAAQEKVGLHECIRQRRAYDCVPSQ